MLHTLALAPLHPCSLCPVQLLGQANFGGTAGAFFALPHPTVSLYSVSFRPFY